ncbi:MAG: hypothetical protein EBR79_03035 [Proteobacteria bacterium]|nr:hypothetical protein [Pseudomonadota bacterium]
MGFFGFGSKPADAAGTANDPYGKLDPNVRKEVVPFVNMVQKEWGLVVNHPNFGRSPFAFQLKTFFDKMEREIAGKYPVLAAFAKQKLVNVNALLMDGMSRNKLVSATKLLAGFEEVGRKVE